MNTVQTCKYCGCTENDCRQCIAKTGEPCYWIAEDVCSACADQVDSKLEKEISQYQKKIKEQFLSLYNF